MVSPRREGESKGAAGRLASPLAERMRCGRSIGVTRADAGNALANMANVAMTSRIFLTRVRERERERETERQIETDRERDENAAGRDDEPHLRLFDCQSPPIASLQEFFTVFNWASSTSSSSCSALRFCGPRWPGRPPLLQSSRIATGTSWSTPAWRRSSWRRDSLPRNSRCPGRRRDSSRFR